MLATGVAAAGVRCADARALVRKLAPKAAGAGVNHATYSSLNCFIAAKQGKAGIESIGAQRRKLVLARAP